MKRISIFIREDQFEGINRLSRQKDISSSELIREAIDYKLLTDFGKDSKKQTLQKSFGILSDRFEKNAASKDAVRAIRSEWENRIERNKK